MSNRPRSQSGGKVTGVAASANTIIWDGPNLDCIGLCKGDSVQDVIYKAAQVICALKEMYNLSDLELHGLFINQNPATLNSTLQGMLDKLFDHEGRVKVLERASASSDPVIKNIAQCFRDPDQNGDPITELKHSEYTRAIGLEVCAILNELTQFTARMDSLENEVYIKHENRLDNLEKDNGELDDLTERVEDLETGAQALAQVLGTNTDLSQAYTAQPDGSQGVRSLVDNSLVLFTGSAGTGAEIIRRMLLMIKDMRAAITLIQENCCKITCDDITIDFDIRMSDDRSTMTLFFPAKSSLPNGFEDMDPLGNILTITDSAGARHQVRVKIADAVQDVDGIVIDLSGSPLDPKSAYELSMDAKLTSDSFTCVKCINKTVAYRAGSGCDYCEVKVDGADLAGEVVIFYTLNTTTGGGS